MTDDRPTKTSRLVIPICCLILIVCLGASVSSLPRLAVEHAANCGICHVDPNGGGMRNEFGNQSIALQELCFPQTKRLVEDKATSPVVSEALQVGFDFRHTLDDNGTFTREQTDAYVSVRPLRMFSYQIRVDKEGLSENYALLWLHGQDYFIKAGRFQPTFGLQNIDSYAFNRRLTGNRREMYLDGLSVGGEFFDVLNVSAEVFNTNDRDVFGFRLYAPWKLGPFSCMAGTSLRLAKKLDGSYGDFPHAKAVFGGLSFGPFTAMGELDLVGQSNDTLITYGALTVGIMHGLYLQGEYDFFDGDRRYAGGVDEFFRVGLDLYPLPFVELRPEYTRHTRGYRENEDDFLLRLHVGY